MIPRRPLHHPNTLPSNMKPPVYQLIGTGYPSTADVPKDRDIYYRCESCGAIIPSTPKTNIGCQCNNLFIDKDYWRFAVLDLEKLSVLRRIS
jgi:hypothetical protein